MKLRKISRIIALFLVMITMIGFVPITTKAAVKSDVPYPMRSNFVLDALQYLGYDVDKLKTDGHLYQEGYYGGDLVNESNSSKRQYGLNILSDIVYDDGGSVSGLNTKNGKPNVEYFESMGLNCASFVTYVYLNYLPNVAKKADGTSYKDDTTYKYIKSAMEHWHDVNGWSYQADDTWREAFNDYADGDIITKYKASYSNISQMESKTSNSGLSQIEALNLKGVLSPGDLICLGRLNTSGTVRDWVHVAIYLGTYNGQDYVAHCTGGEQGERRPNGDGRGPEISTLAEIFARKTGDKFSYPIEFYHLKWEYNYGTIKINKADENGKKLAGAMFEIENVATGEIFDIITNSNGEARTPDIPFGTYTVTETVFPEGYGTGSMTYNGKTYNNTDTITVVLDANTTSGIININAVNKPNEGTIYGFKCRDDGVNPLSQISGAKIGIFRKSEIDEYKKEYPSAPHKQIYTDARAVDTCISGTTTTTPSGETGKVGLYIFEDLDYDTYIIAEMEAPIGYELTTSTRTVKLESSLKMVGESEGGAIRNHPRSVTVYGFKCEDDGVNPLTQISGAKIGLFKKADIDKYKKENEGAKYEEIYSEDNAYKTCISGTTTTTPSGETGKVGLYIFEKIEYGTYVIAEIESSEGYQEPDESTIRTIEINDEIYSKLPIHNNIKVLLVTDKYTEEGLGAIRNYPITGSVKGYKVNEKKEGINGVVFGLFYMDATVFSQKNAYKTCTTYTKDGIDGYFEFEDVRYGEYLLVEITPPKEHFSSGRKYTVQISQKDEVIDIGEIENHTITVDLCGYKTDEQGRPLKGAVFGLFDNFSKTTEDEAMDVCTSDENGYFEFKNVPLGSYYVREIYPVSGYEKTDTFYLARIEQMSQDMALVNLTFRPNGTIEGAFSKKYFCCYEEIHDGAYGIVYRQCVYNESQQTYEKGEVIKGLKTIFKTFVFENIVKPISITIKKHDDNGTVLEGATFLLEWSLDGKKWQEISYTSEYTAEKGTTTSNVVNGELTTNNTGIVMFEGLTPDIYYRLTETKAPDGFSMLKDSVYEGRVGKTQKLTFTVVNNPIFKLPPTGGYANYYIPVSIIAAGIFLCVSILIIKRQVKKG